MILQTRRQHRQRVIVNSDAKNEVDDQYAIVHAILTPSFELHGVIAAHFGKHPGRPQDSMQASLHEVNLLLRLMHLEQKVRVEEGARDRLPDAQTPCPSSGAQLIIEQAMSDDERPLNVLFFGPLTDMASALLMEPRIGQRNVHVIWVGGSETRTHYGPEFNLSNDIHAANIVMRSRLAVSTIPYPLYGYFCASHAELIERVAPHGAIGRYLVEQVLEWNDATDGREYRSLGDSPAVGVLLAPRAGKFTWDQFLAEQPVQTLGQGRSVDRPPSMTLLLPKCVNRTQTGQFASTRRTTPDSYWKTFTPRSPASRVIRMCRPPLVKSQSAQLLRDDSRHLPGQAMLCQRDGPAAPGTTRTGEGNDGSSRWPNEWIRVPSVTNSPDPQA